MKLALLTGCMAGVLGGGSALAQPVAAAPPAAAAAPGMAMPGMPMPGMASSATPADDRQALLDRIEALERRLADVEARTASAPSVAPSAALEGPARASEGGEPQPDRTAELEQRVTNLETNVVLSEPKATVKRIQVWVDKNGNEYDHEVPGAKLQTTYQRETTSRRQAISEEIEEAMSDAESKRVGVGVNSAFTLQSAFQTLGRKTPADGHAYALASADLLFTAGLAQNTMFFADIVGLSGNPPDLEINPLTLLNSFTARLSRQNELNLREAWVRTQLFHQKLDITAGRLDLTNFFDRNAVANDESSQFLSDSLVNNPSLGLASNGAGVAAVYDPYSSLSFRVGVQQSDPAATSLSKSIFALGEVDYLMRPFGLPEGHYRIWGRTDNSFGTRSSAYGFSVDQKISPFVTVFARYGSGRIGTDYMHFYSAGLSFAQKYVFNPLDTWGVGYSHTQFVGREEDLAELYYNLHLTEKLRVSPHLQYVREGDGSATRAFILPGLRLQAAF